MVNTNVYGLHYYDSGLCY